jgi:hypothetical protein
VSALDHGDAPAVYSVDEVVELFGGRRGRSAVYEDLRRGTIPSLRLGRRLFIPGWYVEQLRSGSHGDQRVISRPPTSADDPDTRGRT